MIAIDTSVLVAIVLEEPEAETFKSVLRQEEIVVGWPTLFETSIYGWKNGVVGCSFAADMAFGGTSRQHHCQHDAGTYFNE